jgi:hypothetical protein
MLFKVIWTGINALMFGLTFENYNSSKEYYYLRALTKVSFMFRSLLWFK